MDINQEIIRGFKNVVDKVVWLNKYKMEVVLKDYKSSEVHCIEYIASHEDVNVTKLSEAFYMTRGAISKLAKKLIAKDIIESYQKPDNKKEIYFRLTAKGLSVNKIHDDLHEEFKERDQAVFDQVTQEELDIILSFTARYEEHLNKKIKEITLETKSK